MKRLIKKSENINTFDNDCIKDQSEDFEDMSNLEELSELSEADIRHERCPKCKYNPLKLDNGFKICPRCDSTYKMLDGTGYIVHKN